MDDTAERLTHLARILNDADTRHNAAAADPVDLHLKSVRLDRIRQLTRAVEDRIGLEPDGLDGITMRLLLDEYTAAVAHLRAVAREAAKRVAGAPAPIKDVGRYLTRQLGSPG